MDVLILICHGWRKPDSGWLKNPQIKPLADAICRLGGSCLVGRIEQKIQSLYFKCTIAHLPNGCSEMKTNVFKYNAGLKLIKHLISFLCITEVRHTIHSIRFSTLHTYLLRSGVSNYIKTSIFKALYYQSYSRLRFDLVLKVKVQWSFIFKFDLLFGTIY